jgi:hypothetical protein
LTVSEYYQVSTLNSQIQSQTKTTSTLTLASTTTVTTTNTCPAEMLCASFNYGPASELRVESVEANTTADALAVFWVTVENSGESPINFDNHALNFSVPANSSVLRQVSCPCFPGGSDLTVGTTLNSGESYTLQAIFPNTKSFDYEVAQAGTVNVTFSFNWSAESQQNMTTISTQFVFP